MLNNFNKASRFCGRSSLRNEILSEARSRISGSSAGKPFLMGREMKAYYSVKDGCLHGIELCCFWAFIDCSVLVPSFFSPAQPHISLVDFERFRFKLRIQAFITIPFVLHS